MIHVPRIPDEETPFVAEIVDHPESNGHFEPICHVRLGSGIRPLLAELPGDRLKDLLAVISFTTNNGRTAPSALDLSGALGVFDWQMLLRMKRLAKLTWNGEPIVRSVRQSSGRTTFVPSAKVLQRRERQLHEAATYHVAPAARNDVIESSRQKYSKPRSEIEKYIEVAHGHMTAGEIGVARAAMLDATPTEDDQIWAVNRLIKAGIDYRLAIKLVKQFGVEKCIQQINWMEFRVGVHRPERYLVGAIQNCYAAPPDSPTYPPPGL